MTIPVPVLSSQDLLRLQRLAAENSSLHSYISDLEIRTLVALALGHLNSNHSRSQIPINTSVLNSVALLRALDETRRHTAKTLSMDEHIAIIREAIATYLTIAREVECSRDSDSLLK